MTYEAESETDYHLRISAAIPTSCTGFMHVLHKLCKFTVKPRLGKDPVHNYRVI